MPLPGQPGSNNPAGGDWQVRKIREQSQTIEQLRGQLSRAKAAQNGAVVNVSVAGSVLTVTFGNGQTTTYQLP